jgi:hypothetical protein
MLNNTIEGTWVLVRRQTHILQSFKNVPQYYVICIRHFLFFCHWRPEAYNNLKLNNILKNTSYNNIIFYNWIARIPTRFDPFLWVILREWTPIRGSAFNLLARPGRKQDTATKFGIYSTYSPQSSIHFLARCSNFCKPLTKNFRLLSVQPGLRGSNDLRFGRKIATFQLFFQSREHMVVRQGHIRRIG